ncbi:MULTISPECIES: YggT family protein [Borreliella]|uniref:YggT family protein n=2 Tax=Borrelia garinii subsp. bavariensis (strain ATCC BAA-2496 / DSM 23469 / PBi) TaxID=290434 RepID=A0ABM7AQV7_BORGP|nr:MULTISPECIES: YggT family protein [Borreliella]AZA27112.1 YggT family protein [Borreliella bavariensis PBi]WLN24490.1 YggT family protein [Borreliella bavariensis]
MVFLQIYRILILVRIILSWLVSSGINTNVFFRFIYIVTEPFLSFFRRIPFFTFGMFDFSPIAALITLTILERMLAYGNYKLSTFIILFIVEIWGIFRSIFIAIVFFLLLRLLLLLLNLFQGSDFFKTVDSFLIPLSTRISGVITDKHMSYTSRLIIGSALMVAFIIIIEQVVFAIRVLGEYLPF